jgi:hypothetical protein
VKPIKDIIDNRVHKAGTPGLKIIEMIDHQDAEDKTPARIISDTILTNRGRGQDVIDPYQMAQRILRNKRRRTMQTDSEATASQ